jgi:hypothetical protein
VSDTNPSSAFGLPLPDRTKTAVVGRTGQGTPPVCHLRPVVSPTTQAATTAFTVSQGTWDDADQTTKYSYLYEWYEAADSGEDFKPMALSSLATPKTSAASTAATKIMCMVTAVNRSTGAATTVMSSQATAT